MFLVDIMLFWILRYLGAPWIMQTLAVIAMSAHLITGAYGIIHYVNLK